MSPISPENPNPSRNPIEFGHAVDKTLYPETGSTVLCLTIHLPDSSSLALLRSQGPNHFTTGNVQILAPKSEQHFFKLQSTDCDSSFELKGPVAVRLDDANPPTGHNGKSIHFFIGNPEMKKATQPILPPVVTIERSKWTDETNLDKVDCKGTIVRIFGNKINQIIDPSTILYPLSPKVREQIKNTYDNWINFQIEYAKSSAIKTQKKRQTLNN